MIPGNRHSKSQIIGFSFRCAKPCLTSWQNPPLAEAGLHGERGDTYKTLETQENQ
jgi:hypothetical protein